MNRTKTYKMTWIFNYKIINVKNLKKDNNHKNKKNYQKSKIEVLGQIDKFPLKFPTNPLNKLQLIIKRNI